MQLTRERVESRCIRMSRAWDYATLRALETRVLITASIHHARICHQASPQPRWREQDVPDMSVSQAAQRRRA